jgi:tetratricopeptide (TPR) repeat protein
MDPRHLQRFHNEARAAASLHHAHIVPVYAVGCERGIHYYAMQFIDGQTLAQFLERQRREAETQQAGEPAIASPVAPAAETSARAKGTTACGPCDPASFRRVAAWGVQAAAALEHAHQLGIVHRDVKPGNLLLDAQGKLWVTDFGLARLGADTGLTMTGDLVGTLRYMSPEQALAKRVVIDHRTDIYSLGVTLYELLTDQPAVGGSSREEILRQIVFSEPRPLRQLNRAVPLDLETVVLKALAQEPERRYATAQELAEDLQRWLLDQPIRARRPTLGQRLARWGRRHRPVVAAAAAVLLLALGLAGYVAWTSRERAGQRAETERVVLLALEESASLQQQRRLPEALSAARRADGLLAGAAVDEPLRQRVKARLADLELVDRLEKGRLEVERYGSAGIDAWFQVRFREVGLDLDALSAEEAAERLRRTTVAVELAVVLDQWAFARRKKLGWKNHPEWKRLLRVARLADPDGWRARVRVAMEKNDRRALRRLAASKEVFGLPVANLNVLGGALLEDKEAARPVANLNVLGGVLLEDKEAGRPVEVFLREVQRRHPNDFRANEHLLFYFKERQPPHWEEVVHFAAVAVALRPASPAAHVTLGKALLSKGRPDEAIAEFRQALRLKRDSSGAYMSPNIAGQEEFLGARDPSNAHYNISIALAMKGRLDEAIAAHRKVFQFKHDDPTLLVSLGDTLLLSGRLDEAIAASRQAIRLKKDKCEAYNILGVALGKKGRTDEAIAAFQKALKLNPYWSLVQNNLAWLLATCPELKLRDPVQAVKLAKRAVKRAPKTVQEAKQAIKLIPELVTFRKTLGVAHYRAGQWQAARTALLKSMELRQGGDAADWFFLAMTSWQLGDKAKARSWYARAVAWMDKKAPKDPELARFRAEAAALLGIKKGPAAHPKRTPPKDP